MYFTPPFPYPAKEPRSLSIRIFLIRSSRLGMSGWSSKRRENQSPAAAENMFQVDQSDGKFHPQSKTAGIFVGGIFISPAAELCEKPKRNLQKYFQEIILYEDKKIDNAYKNPQDRNPA